MGGGPAFVLLSVFVEDGEMFSYLIQCKKLSENLFKLLQSEMVILESLV